VSTELMTDPPSAALLHAGDAASLLVLGISTTGAADELVTARVAQRVLARAPQPVVVVPRPGADGAPGRPVVAVLGLGGAADDEAVTAFAAAAARRAGRPLELVDTRTGTPAETGGTADPADLEVRRTRLPNPPPHRLLAATCPTPLLVVPAAHGGRLARLDALHRQLLRHCTSPMAMAPVARPPADPVPAGR
jgi:hypothetical protein